MVICSLLTNQSLEWNGFIDEKLVSCGLTSVAFIKFFFVQICLGLGKLLRVKSRIRINISYALCVYKQMFCVKSFLIVVYWDLKKSRDLEFERIDVYNCF